MRQLQTISQKAESVMSVQEVVAAVEFAFFDRDVDRRWINDDPTLILNNISDQCFVNVDNMYRNQR